MIKFREKAFSIWEDTLRGAVIGGSIAGGTDAVFRKLNREVKFPLFREKQDKISEEIKDVNRKKLELSKDYQRNKNQIDALNKKVDKLRDASGTYVAIGGTIVGAALGALVGTIKWTAKKFGNKAIYNKCLDDVIANLKKIGFKEDTHFTKNKRVADTLKTKVTVAIVKSNGDLVVLINSKNDFKLAKINNDIIKNLPTETISQKENDKFNEITITSMSSNNGDSLFLASIAERFIRAGFPVYLIEVG